MITDQQRAPRHWPDDPGWLTRADAERRRAAPGPGSASATRSATRRCARRAARPCSPAATRPSTGSTLTLTAADLRPDPRNAPGGRRGRWPGSCGAREAPRAPGADASSPAGRCASGPRAGNEPSLPPGMPNLATLLRERGLQRRLQGQVAPDPSLERLEPARRLERGRRGADRARLRLRRLGAARRGRERQGRALRRRQRRASGEGWDEVYTRQAERWLGRADLPEPFCLVVSLVNPHDVLGYPASYRARRLHARRVPRPRRRACRRPSTRTCATSRPCTR